ncbi:hypothetical protein T484DRAFT_1809484 [Baffinella frigidus]|nr:hypothetical protein T484DRAFT_1809484 [Cryptophyta sp. CCMP2293]
MSGLGLLGVALWARFQRIFYTRTTKDAAARLKKRQAAYEKSDEESGEGSVHSTSSPNSRDEVDVTSIGDIIPAGEALNATAIASRHVDTRILSDGPGAVAIKGEIVFALPESVDSMHTWGRNLPKGGSNEPHGSTPRDRSHAGYFSTGPALAQEAQWTIEQSSQRISELAEDSSDAARSIGAAGGVDVLLDSMRRWPESRAVQLRGIEALVSLGIRDSLSFGIMVDARADLVVRRAILSFPRDTNVQEEGRRLAILLGSFAPGATPASLSGGGGQTDDPFAF